MTFLECRHSLVLCPGARRPRRRASVGRWNTAMCGPEREAHGTWPARYDGPRLRAPRARTRLSHRRHGDARARARTQPRGRMPERSVRERRGWRQASSGAKRRCRRPGGASQSPGAHAEPDDAADAATARLATRARLNSLNPTDAARGVPPKRKVRKMDSLSAATRGPTSMMLRFVSQCVNGGARRDLEFGV